MLFIRYEGGHIGVSGDRQKAAEWYIRNLGLIQAWDSLEEGQTLLSFPGGQAIPLVSVRGGTKVNIWGPEESLQRSGNTRLCFACPDLDTTQRVLKEEGVETTSILPGPGRVDCFDFYDLEGTRLTAVAAPDQSKISEEVLFSGYAPLRIGVSAEKDAAAWYQRHLSMDILQDFDEEGSMLMGMGSGLTIWLETLPREAFQGRQFLYTRPYFLTLDINIAQDYCQDQGFMPSEIFGTQEGLRVFHFFDPFGNQLNAWTYPGAKPEEALNA